MLRAHFRRERGYAAAILLVLVTLGVLGALVSQLNDLAVARPAESRSGSGTVLGDARDALLAFAANHPRRIDPTNIASALLEDRPGGLPCPDRDADGFAEPTCDLPAQRFGLLPWRTLDLPNAPRIDGELLWYAVAETFRTQTVSPVAFAINFDSAGPSNGSGQGGLLQVIRTRSAAEVSSNAPARDIAPDAIAIVLAPGPALPGQVRPAPPAVNIAQPSAYFEGENAKDVAQADPPDPDGAGPRPGYLFVRLFALGDAPGFNDRGIVIRPPELFAAVEPVVEARIRATVIPQMRLNNRVSAPPYRSFSGVGAPPPITTGNTAYGAYPYPVPWDDPTNAPYFWAIPLYADYNAGGFNPQTFPREGRLPFAPLPAGRVTWVSQNAAPVGAPIAGATGACVVSPSYTLDCIFTNTTAAPVPYIVDAEVRDAGHGFFLPLINTDIVFTPPAAASGLTMINHVGMTQLGRARITIDLNVPPTSTITFSARTPRPNTFLLDDPAAPLAFSAPTGWFVRNQWYRFAYYAVTQGGRPGWSALPCGVAPEPCISVCYPACTPGGEAALVLVGARARTELITTGQIRPDTARESYLDLANNTAVPAYSANPPGRSFEHTPSKDRSNDRVIAIAP